MQGIEWKRITPEELVQDIEGTVRRSRENKYAFQVGLKDLDFDVDQEQLKSISLSLPFVNINQAEQALRSHAIQPIKLIEYDDTEHQVLAFDSRPVGYSGFMDCVTHSLALTNKGLFEVGRYPAVELSSPGRYWQWFIHCQLATVEEVNEICSENNLTTDQFMEEGYKLIVSRR
jgi:hypothetical protein